MAGPAKGKWVLFRGLPKKPPLSWSQHFWVPHLLEKKGNVGAWKRKALRNAMLGTREGPPLEVPVMCGSHCLGEASLKSWLVPSVRQWRSPSILDVVVLSGEAYQTSRIYHLQCRVISFLDSERPYRSCKIRGEGACGYATDLLLFSSIWPGLGDVLWILGHNTPRVMTHFVPITVKMYIWWL